MPKKCSSIDNFLESKLFKRLAPEERVKPFDFNPAYEIITG